MPSYDYQCRSCGFITEVVHSMLEVGPTTCGRCGGQLRRVFHPTGIIFKGGGFYKTDSRSSSGSVGGSSPDGSAGSGDAKSGDAKSGDASAPASSLTETKASDAGSAPKSSGSAGKDAGGGG